MRSPSGMNESEEFRERLLALIKERQLQEAPLSVKAGLNRRAVTDIREGQTKSPKISTVFALARALDVDVATLLGLDVPRADTIVDPVALDRSLEEDLLVKAFRKLPNRRKFEWIHEAYQILNLNDDETGKVTLSQDEEADLVHHSVQTEKQASEIE